MNTSKYEAVIGLEVHAQLQTNTKLFCGDSIAFGAAPNTHVSPITLGHPGTLPKTNTKAIDFAVMLGLACNCEIVSKNYFARKNYFYPDLPKGYQISQHTTPICKGGIVPIKVDGVEKNIELNRIHIEEDAGKSIHDLYETDTCIDLNRAGTPLLEIVTEPCLHSSEEAFQYVTEIRKLVRWIGVCDGNMEEGSLRCDANVSIRLKGETKLGTKVEVKNVNSIRNVKRAIDAEIKRMIELVENGGTVVQQTRSYDVNTDKTSAIREKEDANDYRYFADPDLTPFHLSQEYISKIKNLLPVLPKALATKYKEQLGLSEYDANVLCDEKATADFFNETTEKTNNYKAAANFILGPVKQYLNENNLTIAETSLTAISLANLIQLVDEGKVNFSVASSKILPILFTENKNALQIAEEQNLLQSNDSNEIEGWVTAVIENMPDKVAEYKKGKKGLIGLFVGEVKKISKGKADPKVATDLLTQKLNS
ncbi:MAG: Asp-tRNA(Asn)/Glu-tRNA(Gln) amidotransferase subunit GatB [Chitinophagaceae bacterium]